MSAEVIKIDKTRKQITLKERESFGKTKVVKAKQLSEINYIKFDKHKAEYYNRGGLTYVFANNVPVESDEIDVQITSKMSVDAELKARYFAGLSEEDKIEIQKVKEEYDL